MGRSIYRPAALWKIAKTATASYLSHDPLTLGAALAYYTVFSLAPILVIVIAVAGWVFGADAVRGEVARSLGGLLGGDGAKQVEAMIRGAYKPGEGALAAGVAFVLLVVGATAVFGQMRSSLDYLWDVKPKPRSGYLKYLTDRVISFAMVACLGFLLLVSLAVDAALTGATRGVARDVPQALIVAAGAAEFLFSFAVTVVLFAIVYKFLSDARVHWRDVWAGAVATTVLFLLGKYAIGLYLGRRNVAEVYGVAGSVLLLFLWVYWSSQIVFFGAELTRAFAEARGEKIGPRSHAVETKIVEVEKGQSPRPA